NTPKRVNGVSMDAISINHRNPASGEELEQFKYTSLEMAKEKAYLSHFAQILWKSKSLDDRSERLRDVARILENQKDRFAQLITREMGKLMSESRAEIEKCAKLCRYYADNAPRFLADQEIASDHQKSVVTFQPLGVILAI